MVQKWFPWTEWLALIDSALIGSNLVVVIVAVACAVTIGLRPLGLYGVLGRPMDNR
jgi:pheromone shutdown protein TraB